MNNITLKAKWLSYSKPVKNKAKCIGKEKKRRQNNLEGTHLGMNKIFLENDVHSFGENGRCLLKR